MYFPLPLLHDNEFRSSFRLEATTFLYSSQILLAYNLLMHDLLSYVFHFLAHQIKRFAVEDTDIVGKKAVC